MLAISIFQQAPFESTKEFPEFPWKPKNHALQKRLLSADWRISKNCSIFVRFTGESLSETISFETISFERGKNNRSFPIDRFSRIHGMDTTHPICVTPSTRSLGSHSLVYRFTLSSFVILDKEVHATDTPFQPSAFSAVRRFDDYDARDGATTGPPPRVSR